MPKVTRRSKLDVLIVRNKLCQDLFLTVDMTRTSEVRKKKKLGAQSTKKRHGVSLGMMMTLSESELLTSFEFRAPTYVIPDTQRFVTCPKSDFCHESTCSFPSHVAFRRSRCHVPNNLEYY